MKDRFLSRRGAKLLLLATAVLVSCSSPGEDINRSPIRIGVVLSLSGERETYGRDCLNGIQMSIDLANIMGGVKGRNLELVVEDDGSSTVRTMEAVRRLASDRTVLGIIGGTSSKLALTGASVAQELRIPFISPVATNPNVTATGSYISRICFIDPFQGSALAEYSHNLLKLGKMGIIFDPEDEYSLGLATYFKKRYLEEGGELLFEIFQTEADLDSTAIVAAIKEKKPDAVFLPGYHKQAAELVRLVKPEGLEVAMLGGDGWESPEFDQATADILSENDQVYITTHFSPDNTKPLVQRFVADYRSRHGKVPTASAALGYDAAGVVSEALRRTPQLSRNACSEAINSTTDYNGVTGTISLNEKRNPMKEVVILKAYGGGFIFEAT
ncbi:MAG: ABC transporter substrate-binding protein, partial [Candidatus Zixiibacteriota bacterium]